MKLKEILLTLITVLATLFFLFLVLVVTYASFQGPTEDPPGGNVPPPVNIGEMAQHMEGPLSVGDLVKMDGDEVATKEWVLSLDCFNEHECDDCGDWSSWSCDGNDRVRVRTCYNCELGQCVPYQEEDRATCPTYCQNGNCVDCISDNDCPDCGSWSSWYCDGSSRVRERTCYQCQGGDCVDYSDYDSQSCPNYCHGGECVECLTDSHCDDSWQGVGAVVETCSGTAYHSREKEACQNNQCQVARESDTFYIEDFQGDFISVQEIYGCRPCTWGHSCRSFTSQGEGYQCGPEVCTCFGFCGSYRGSPYCAGRSDCTLIDNLGRCNCP